MITIASKTSRTMRPSIAGIRQSLIGIQTEITLLIVIKSLIISDDEDFKSLFPSINDSEEEEDFEAEMERERKNHVNGVHKQSLSSPSSGMTSSTNRAVDEESDPMTAKNDDLLYDPQSDESDQKWIDNERRVARSVSTTHNISDVSGGRVGVAVSDATLNCPACLTQVCLDCQRHDVYRTQYRAMFVRNCRIDFNQRLQFKDKSKKRRRNANQISETTSAVDIYHPVFCEICNTQIAVYDSEEVYHFFHVLASF